MVPLPAKGQSLWVGGIVGETYRSVGKMARMSCTICLAWVRRAAWSRGHQSGFEPSCKSLSIVVAVARWVSVSREDDASEV